MWKLTLGVVVVACLLLGTAFGQEASRDKKLIEWGWDEPDTKFIRENIQQMEELPFDGLIFHVLSSQGGNLVWEMWGTRRFELAEFQHAIDDLKATPFRRLTDRFLRVNVTPGKVDWFDDQAWAVVLQNYTVAAQVAKQGGCQGFMFDVEQYEGQTFDYRQQPHRETKPFAEYQAKVRQRGQEWMKAVGGQFPDLTMLLTFGYSIAQPAAVPRTGPKSATACWRTSWMGCWMPVRPRRRSWTPGRGPTRTNRKTSSATPTTRSR